MEDAEPVVPATTEDALDASTSSVALPNLRRTTSSRVSSAASRDAEWDDGLLLEHMKKPLVFEFNPLQEILGAFHGKIKQITEHQYSVLKKLREQFESMKTKVGSMEGKIETVVDVGPPDADMMAMLARLTGFADKVEAVGGMSMVENISSMVDASGGPEACGTNMALFSEVTEMAGGPNDFGELLTGIKSLLASTGGAGDLMRLLRVAADLVDGAGGSVKLLDMLLSVQTLRDAAGGSEQVAALLTSLHNLVNEAGGPEPLATCLATLQALSEQCGGQEGFASMLCTVQDLVSACGGADPAAELLRDMHETVALCGGKEAFAAMLRALRTLMDAVGGGEGLANLFRSLQRILDGIGGVEALLAVLAAGGGSASGSASVGAAPAAVQTDLEARLAALEADMKGLHKCLEDIKASGRAEALGDVVAQIEAQLAAAAQVSVQGRRAGRGPRAKPVNVAAGAPPSADAAHARIQAHPIEAVDPGPTAAQAETHAAGGRPQTSAASSAMAALTGTAPGDKLNNRAGPEPQGDPAAANPAAHPQQDRRASGHAAESLTDTEPAAEGTASELAGTEAMSSSHTASSERAGQAGPSQAGEPGASEGAVHDVEQLSMLPSAAESTVVGGDGSSGAAANDRRPSTTDAAESDNGDRTGSHASPAALELPAMAESHAAQSHVDAEQAPAAGYNSFMTEEPDGQGERAPADPSDAAEQANQGDAEPLLVQPLTSGTPSPSPRPKTLAPAAPASADRPATSSQPQRPQPPAHSPAQGVRQGSTSKSDASSPASAQLPEEPARGAVSFAAAFNTGARRPAGGDHQAAASHEGRPAADSPDTHKATNLFKTQALKVVAESRLGMMKRFASEELNQKMSAIEQPVSDVLSSLVGALAGGNDGASQEEFDELSELVQRLHARSLEVEVAIEELYAGKADKAEVSTLARALNELWKAVKEMQDPEGDEGRGVKGLRAKCISCDRPLNMTRENKLGELPTGSPAPIHPNQHGPRGPGWEAAPKRALTNGDYDGFAELTSKQRSRSPQKGTQVERGAQARPKTSPAGAGDKAPPAPGSLISEGPRGTGVLPAARGGAHNPRSERTPPAPAPTAAQLGKERARLLEELQDSKGLSFHSAVISNAPGPKATVMRNRQ